MTPDENMMLTLLEYVASPFSNGQNYHGSYCEEYSFPSYIGFMKRVCKRLGVKYEPSGGKILENIIRKRLQEGADA